MKNLSQLYKRPAALKEKIFSKLFKEAEIAKFTPTELREYENSLKAYRDVKNFIDTTLEQGREEGREQARAEGRAEIVKAMLKRGMDINTISELTGLKVDEIEKLKTEI